MTTTTEDPVTLLYKLQTRFTRLGALRESREAMPPDVADLDAEFRTHENEVEELRASIEDYEIEHRDLKINVQENEAQLAHFQTQLGLVKTSREYSAVLNEIDGTKRSIGEIQVRLGELEVAHGEDSERLEELEEKLPKEREAFESQVTHWREFQSKCDVEIETLESERVELEGQLNVRLTRVFDRLMKHRGGMAVVKVETPACPACNVRLRPALFQRVKRESRREIISCESCQRILFYSDVEVS